jgi:hypothetical protein
MIIFIALNRILVRNRNLGANIIIFQNRIIALNRILVRNRNLGANIIIFQNRIIVRTRLLATTMIDTQWAAARRAAPRKASRLSRRALVGDSTRGGV